MSREWKISVALSVLFLDLLVLSMFGLLAWAAI